MLFEIPGMNLGAPKTDEVKKQHSKLQNIDLSKIAKNAKDRNPQKITPDASVKLRPKSNSSKNAVAERGTKTTQVVPSKSLVQKSIPRKIEKESGKSKLQQKMEEKLRGARFRYLNQKLYQSKSHEALEHFTEHPEDFQKYHEGFRSQVVHWPVNPVDLFIDQIEKDLSTKQQEMIIVDMGCGEAKIMRHFLEHKSYYNRIKVHSFDLAVSYPGVAVCDMSKVPLQDSSVDVVIFCLSLMNTNFIDAIREARRILKPKSGVLRIAEVESRFDNGPNKFISAVEEIGFKKRVLNTQYKVFTLFEFAMSDYPQNKFSYSNPKESENIVLKPCLYKKR